MSLTLTSPARVAGAIIASNQVDTQRMITALVCRSCTFVNIREAVCAVEASASTIACIIVCGDSVNTFSSISTFNCIFKRWRWISAWIVTQLTIVSIKSNRAITHVVCWVGQAEGTVQARVRQAWLYFLWAIDASGTWKTCVTVNTRIVTSAFARITAIQVGAVTILTWITQTFVCVYKIVKKNDTSK